MTSETKSAFPLSDDEIDEFHICVQQLDIDRLRAVVAKLGKQHVLAWWKTGPSLHWNTTFDESMADRQRAVIEYLMGDELGLPFDVIDEKVSQRATISTKV